MPVDNSDHSWEWLRASPSLNLRVQSVHLLMKLFGCCGKMPYSAHKGNSPCGRLPFPCMLFLHHTSTHYTSAGPAPRAQAQGFPDLLTPRLWVAELAAVLVGVTVSSLLAFSVGEEQI